MEDRDWDRVVRYIKDRVYARWDSAAAWDAITAPRPASGRPPLASSRAVWHPGLVWALATAVAVVGIALVSRHLLHPAAQPFREFTSATGSRTTVTLRDGTRLTLGPATTLRVPTDFGMSTRTVDLDGEAYFAVVHDARHPFAVFTHNLQIRDVGTEFDVRAYDDEIRVAVARGKVVVGAGRGTARGLGGSRTRPSFPTNTATAVPFQDIPLSAGDMVAMDASGSIVTHHAHIAALTAWMQGGLAFEETPLPTVLHDISRAYGVTIMLADSTLAHSRVTASFQQQSLDVVMNVVTQVVGARYERSGNRIVIHKGVAVADSGATVPPRLNTALSGDRHA